MYYWVCRLEPWYRGLNRIQQALVIVGAVVVVLAMGLWLTHVPSERPRQRVIILNCDHCGTDPERTISYNEYMDRKEQEQRTWFTNKKQELRQQIWDDNGRARWCREHPRDPNCKAKGN
jgi:hypothetical protein